MTVVGADVWKGQWVVVVLDGGGFDRVFLSATIQGAIDGVPGAEVIGVDIPIGLPGPGQRRPADVMARACVGPRWQSVFMTPPAEVLAAPSHARANEVARLRGWDGISAQAYGLRGMILQVQPVAEQDGRVYEVHPEVSFARANGGSPLPWPKSSWNGQSLRRRILADNGIVIPDDLAGPGMAGASDILDAAIVAWSATRIGAGVGEALPEGAARIGAIWR